jgi:hypothetical protein
VYEGSDFGGVTAIWQGRLRGRYLNCLGEHTRFSGGFGRLTWVGPSGPRLKGPYRCDGAKTTTKTLTDPPIIH